MIHIKIRHNRSFPFINLALKNTTMFNRSLSWSLIVLTIVIFLIPYAIGGNTLISLGAYSMFEFLPLIVAAYLRGWKGSLFTWLLISLVLLLKVFFDKNISWSPNEVGSLISFNVVGLAFSWVAGHVCSLNRQLTIANSTMKKQALTDSLTDLPNHRAIIERIEKEIEHSCLFGCQLSLIFLDVDHFKQINDTYGHRVGDAALKQLGKLIYSELQEEGTVGRYGGDEFVVLLTGKNNNQATVIAERIRSAVATFSLAKEHVREGIKKTISVGIATYPKDGSTCDELLANADRAMYLAKKLGRNKVYNTPVRVPNCHIMHSL